MFDYQVQHDYDDVLKACDLVHNTLTIQGVLRTCGKTPEMVELVGNENLENIGSLIGEAWGNLSQRLKNLSRSMTKKLAETFAKSSAAKRLEHPVDLEREVKIRYDLDSIKTFLERKFVLVKTPRQIGQLTMAELEALLAQHKQAILAEYRKVAEGPKDYQQYKHADKILKITEYINSVNNNRALGLAQIPELLEKLAPEITNQVRAHQVVKSMEHIPELLFIAFEPPLKVERQELPTLIRQLTAVAKFLFDVGCFAYRMLAQIETYLIQRCHEGQKLIYVEMPIPSGVAAEIDKFFGGKGKFHLRNCYVTNLVGRFAQANEEGRPYGGYSINESEYRKGSTNDIWINANLVSSKLQRARLTGALTMRDALLQIFVHEARHVFDGQHGKIEKIYNSQDNSEEYQKSEHERVAREAQRDYRWTPEMKKWIEALLQKLAVAFRNREKYLRDNAALEKEVDFLA